LKLDKISRKIGIDLSYFLPRGMWISSRYFAMTLIALLISVAFARLTSKETYGQYQYVISMASLLSVFSLPGLNTAALRAFVEGDEEAVAQSVVYSFFASFAGSIILLGIAVYRYAHAEHTLGIALVISALLLPFFYAPNGWYIYYEGKLNYHSPTIRLIAANLIMLVGILIGLKAGANLVGLTLIYFGLNALITVLFFLEGRRKAQSRVGPSKLSFRYAALCTVQKFTSSIGENVQTIAVSSIFGFANLAIYQVAQSFVNAFSGLTGALSSTYFPLLLRYRKLNHGAILFQHLILGLAFAAIYIVAIQFLFAPLYGVKYQSAIELAHRLSFIVLILPLRIYLTNFFTARDRNQIVIATNVAACVIALLIFIVEKNQGFTFAAVTYLYALNVLMIVPLFIAYLYLIIKRTDSD
jgi:O-antigen/teichoic acid export membrane protein